LWTRGENKKKMNGRIRGNPRSTRENKKDRKSTKMGEKGEPPPWSLGVGTQNQDSKK